MRNKRSNHHYIPYDPDQQLLIPLNMRDWLPKNHVAYFILDVLSTLDLSPLDPPTNHHKGRPAYDSSMMVALLIYARIQRVSSTRMIEKRTYEDIGFRLITGNQQPDHHTIHKFRTERAKAIQEISVTLLAKLYTLKLVTLTTLSIDGTKIEAFANSHKSLTYDEMLKQEETLRMLIQQKLKETAEQEDKIDQEEDRKFGASHNPYTTPECFKNLPPEKYEQKHKQLQELIHHTQQDYIREAKEAHLQKQKELDQTYRNKKKERKLEKLERQKNNQKNKGSVVSNDSKQSNESKETEDLQASDLPDKISFTAISEELAEPRRQILAPLTPAELIPPPSYQRNRTDFDSRIMKSGSHHGFIQGYNMQGVVDGKHGFLVNLKVTQSCNDQKELIPLLQTIPPLRDLLQSQSQAQKQPLLPETSDTKETKETTETNKMQPIQVLTDAGYCSNNTLLFLQKQGYDGLIATKRSEAFSHRKKKQDNNKKQKKEKELILLSHLLTPIQSYQDWEERCQALEQEKNGESTGESTSIDPVDSLKENSLTNRLGLSLRDEMEIKLKTEAGKEAYKKRSYLSEGTFGILKYSMGLRKFSSKGLSRTQAEANLAMISFNIRKLFSLQQKQLIPSWG